MLPNLKLNFCPKCKFTLNSSFTSDNYGITSLRQPFLNAMNALYNMSVFLPLDKM